jgi:hypothetical protein
MRFSLLPFIVLCLVSAGLAETQQRSANTEVWLPNNDNSRQEVDLGRFGVLRLDPLATDDAGDVCYMLRTYRVEREEQDSDATRIVAEYKFQHASKFSVKKARPQELPEP